ncbi:MAG TPA: hypothetical protein VHD85_00415 [Terracidiphilus sp.]|nr:hypothetical protein [Terracidiphilus sp.]
MRFGGVGLGTVGMVLVAGIAGGVAGRVSSLLSAPAAQVQAQERFSGITNCITVVPRSWGDFKGGSDYGLAFQDDKGVVRFVLHPSCGSVNSPAEPPPVPIDLEIQRR